MKIRVAGLALVLWMLPASEAMAATSAGPQSFTVVQIGEADGSVYAAGPIRGVGRDVVLSEEENGPGTTVDFTDQFLFERGSVTIHGTGDVTGAFDQQTCVGRRHLTGNFDLQGGTGAFTGAAGRGTWTGDVTFVLRRDVHGCTDEEAVSLVVFRFVGSSSVG